MAKTAAEQKLDMRIAAQPSNDLITNLVTLEALYKAETDKEKRGHMLLVRAKMIDMLEQRFTEAADHVLSLFEASDAAYLRGEKPPEVDYVAELVAAVLKEMAA